MSYLSDDEAKDNLMRQYLRRFTGQKSPYTKATLMNRLVFAWLNPILSIASKVDFSQDMHYDLSEEDQSLKIADRLETQWRLIAPSSHMEIGSKTPVFGLLKTIWLTFKSQIIKHTGLQIVLAIADFLSIFVVYMTIGQVALIDPTDTSVVASPSSTKAVMLCLLLLLMRSFVAVGSTYSSFRLNLVSMNIRNGLSIMVFKKTMRKSLARDSTFNVAEIEDLYANECESFAALGQKAGFFLGIPFRIVAGIIGLWLYMGNAALLAFCLFFSMYLFNMYLSSVYRRISQRQKQATERRTSLAAEIITNIRQIKIEGLENYFLDKICLVREVELEAIRHQSMRHNASTMLNLLAIASFLVAVFTLRIYSNGVLLLPDAFATIMTFSLFHSSFRCLDVAVISYADCLTALRKLTFYLMSDEVSASFIEAKKFSKTPLGKMASIKISNGNFYWTDNKAMSAYKLEKDRLAGINNQSATQSSNRNRPSTAVSPMMEPLRDDSHASMMVDADAVSIDVNRPSLIDIDIDVSAGSSVAIVGRQSSGKSSLLSAINNDMHHEQGSRIVKLGDIAAMIDRHWLTDDSVKDAIMFGNDYDETRLKHSIVYAALADDVKRLTEGVNTVVGSRGVKISDSVKARLALARAIYSNKEIYLLDDPTEGQTEEHANFIMKDTVLQYLKGKTRLVVTDEIEHLPAFDCVVVMEDGRIAAKGTFDVVSQTEAFKRLKQELDEKAALRGSRTREAMLESPRNVSSKDIPTFNHLQTASDATIDSLVYIEEKKQGRKLSRGCVWSFIRDLGHEGSVMLLAVFGNLT